MPERVAALRVGLVLGLEHRLPLVVACNCGDQWELIP